MTGTTDEVVGQVRRITFWGIAVNLVLAVGKGVVGVIASSQALVADAVHSLSDLATDFAVVFGVKYWTAPADEDHPYGHGKVQALVTLFIGLALLLVAWELGVKAIGVLRESNETVTAPGLLAFVMASVSVVSKEVLYRQTRAVAERVKSPALLANAWHHRSDALSSVPVMVAVAVAHFFPKMGWLDSVGALIVSAFIVRVAWEVSRPALAELIDSGAKEKIAAIEEIAARTPGVEAVHKVRARRSGGCFHADLHVEVDSKLTVAEGHALAHSVKDAILSAGLDVSDALIHVEPKR